MSPRGGQPDPTRVVVTGIGLISGLGRDTPSCWAALLRGESALTRLPAFPDLPPASPPFHGSPAALLHDPELDLDRTAQLAVHAALEAARDAGIVSATWYHSRPQLIDADRTAVLIGTSKGGPASLGRLADHLRSAEPSDPARAAALWTTGWPSTAATAVQARLGTRGPCLAPVAACATGVVAVLQAYRMIRLGQARFALAGAADAGLDPLILGAFRSMKALAPVDHDPRHAIRPWDRRRRGFLVGEGAAVLVLESEASARSRGAAIHAVIAGGTLGADAFHLTDLNPDPTGYAHHIRRAITSANVDVLRIDHVNLHGTATRGNDPLECRALRLALGHHAETLNCSANKPQIGHMLGAAGAAELAFTCLAVRDQIAPPTLNLDDPDPLCDLDATAHVARPRPIRAALKLSLGFGGHIAVAVVQKAES